MNNVNQNGSGRPGKQSEGLMRPSLWAGAGCSGAWPLPVGSQTSFISLKARGPDNILLFGLVETDSWTKRPAVWRTGQTNRSTMPLQWHECSHPLCSGQPASQGLWRTWLLLLFFSVYLLFGFNIWMHWFWKGFLCSQSTKVLARTVSWEDIQKWLHLHWGD